MTETKFERNNAEHGKKNNHNKTKNEPLKEGNLANNLSNNKTTVSGPVIKFYSSQSKRFSR